MKSYARIHKANLCNFGILPLTFKDPSDFEILQKGSAIEFPDIRLHIEQGDKEIPFTVDEKTYLAILEVSDRQRKMLLAGGALNVAKQHLKVQ